MIELTPEAFEQIKRKWCQALDELRELCDAAPEDEDLADAILGAMSNAAYALDALNPRYAGNPLKR